MYGPAIFFIRSDVIFTFLSDMKLSLLNFKQGIAFNNFLGRICICSEMGAHFSPCGRFLAACVACMLPHMEADPGYQTLIHQDPGAGTSPTQHPVSAYKSHTSFALILLRRQHKASFPSSTLVMRSTFPFCYCFSC